MPDAPAPVKDNSRAPAFQPGPCWNMDYDKSCKQMTDWAEMDAFGECV